MRILGIASSLGGTGKTTTSIALASAFQRLGHRIALIDFDIGLGNIERMIGPARLGPDLLDVIDSIKALGPESCTDGLLVIPSSRMSDTRALKPQQIQHLFEHCRALGLDYVICDLPPSLGQPLLGVTNLADDIIVTYTACMPFAQTVSPLLHHLRENQPRAGKTCELHLLITRAPSQSHMPNAWPIGESLPDKEKPSLLGVIPKVDAPHSDSGSAGEADPLHDEGVLTAYAAIATQLVLMHTTDHDEEN